mmetsp:Transcript_9881/g.12446  ORF Transcript_9881/g.12446 Transcript_9881/m.12446 type:complete len:161 (+) Transcript_9881:211-693(+)
MSEEEITVNLISAENEKFPVPLKVAKMSTMICNNIDEDEEITDKDFQCLKVSTDVLSKVVEYCTHYQTVEEMNEISTPLNGETVEDIVKQEWYCNFCKVEREMLFNLVAAANYMDIKPLLDLTCLAVSVSIKGKSVEELRSIFKIADPQTSEQKEEEEKS